MKKIIVKKGNHRSYSFFPKIYVLNRYKSFEINRCFKFTESAFYDLHDEDQGDVNKLFGFSIGYHHNNSCRFGWRPLLEENLIEIVGYEYREGTRLLTEHIGKVEIDVWYEYSIEYLPKYDSIFYNVFDVERMLQVGDLYTEIELKWLMNFGYGLNFYFGGNETAPHDIVVYRRN